MKKYRNMSTSVQEHGTKSTNTNVRSGSWFSFSCVSCVVCVVRLLGSCKLRRNQRRNARMCQCCRVVCSVFPELLAPRKQRRAMGGGHGGAETR